MDENFVRVLDGIITDERKMEKLGENILKMGIKDADERIFQEIEKIIKK